MLMYVPPQRALSAAAAPPPDGNVQLAARISGLISNGICKGKESANAMDAESLKVWPASRVRRCSFLKIWMITYFPLSTYQSSG